MKNNNTDGKESMKDFSEKVLAGLRKNIFTIRDFRKPKVYKLRGYTTTSRVDRKVQSEHNQRLLRNILVAAVFALLLALILIIFNPFKDLREIFRMIGI